MIYLDHAAATPISKKALEAMRPYFDEKFFNPSAAYLPAKQVAAEYLEAKSTIAHAIGAKAADLVITAGATEANNLALSVVDGEIFRFGAFRSAAARELAREPRGDGRERRGTEWNISPVLYLATEHDSVRQPALARGGQAIAVDQRGMIDLSDLRAKITDDTRLISVALANNELGTIQPLAEISAIIKEVRLDRWRRGIKAPLWLHSDASQALNLLDISMARLGVDLLTINSAKVYGPKGVGALYASHDVKLAPLSVGGGQENGLRSGTENVPGVVGFATALTEAKSHLNGNRKKYAEYKRVFLQELQGYELIGGKNSTKTLDNFVNVCYNGIDGERLIYLLEERSVFVATGAACAASKGVKSHVLQAIGLADEQIAGSLRITFGETNTLEQIHEAARIINEVVEAEKRRLGHGE